MAKSIFISGGTGNTSMKTDEKTVIIVAVLVVLVSVLNNNRQNAKAR